MFSMKVPNCHFLQQRFDDRLLVLMLRRKHLNLTCFGRGANPPIPNLFLSHGAD
jgi:hypothetical protein